MSTQQTSDIQIKEEPNVYHDNILDIWGNDFNFSHEKGLAEWLKNSVDAYRRMGESDKNQYISFRFTDETKSSPSTIECLDYAGMDLQDIEKALKWWGDPNAAKRGQKVKVYGGHGNGGKFYMRQMFQSSHFVTYKKGRMSIFGFNEKRKYGFADGYKDKPTSLDEALKIIGIEKTAIPNYLLHRLEHGETGFTLVRGIKPKKLIGKNLPVVRICERLKYHPQARSPLKFSNVTVVHNGKTLINSLRMEEIEPMEGIEGPHIYEIPDMIELMTDDDPHKEINMFDQGYERGKLVLKTTSIPFGRGGRKPELNCIDIVGEIGVIASYDMQQIGFLKYFPQAQYIYGECVCPILEDPDYDCVQNDRERLVDNERTQALLRWICGKIDEVAGKIAARETKQQEEQNTKTTDEFNQILNNWKNQFMSKLFSEILGGPGEGSSTGGYGGEGSGGNERGQSEGKGGSADGEGGGKGDEKKKGLRAPLVLLSGQEDPDYPGLIVTFSDRHFAVEQRQQDVNRGIYWINREKPMAKKLIEKYGVKSPQWRNYLFQRYIDIFTKETIYRLAKKEGGSLTPEQVDTEIMRVASMVYDKATIDLEDYLMNEKFSITGDNE